MSAKLDFLDSYKALEEAIRANGSDLCRLPWVGSCDYISTVLDFENVIRDTDKAEKLKLCRITRNYMQHHGDDFAASSYYMVQFLKDMANDIRLLSGSYKDAMTKCPAAIMAKNSVGEAAAAMVKTGYCWYPVVDMDKKPVGIITEQAIMQALAGSASSRTKVSGLVLTLEKTDILIVSQKESLPSDGAISKPTIVTNLKGGVAGICGPKCCG